MKSKSLRLTLAAMLLVLALSLAYWQLLLKENVIYVDVITVGL